MDIGMVGSVPVSVRDLLQHFTVTPKATGVVQFDLVGTSTRVPLENSASPIPKFRQVVVDEDGLANRKWRQVVLVTSIGFGKSLFLAAPSVDLLRQRIWFFVGLRQSGDQCSGQTPEDKKIWRLHGGPTWAAAIFQKSGKIFRRVELGFLQNILCGFDRNLRSGTVRQWAREVGPGVVLFAEVAISSTVHLGSTVTSDPDWVPELCGPIADRMDESACRSTASHPVDMEIPRKVARDDEPFLLIIGEEIE